MPTTTARETNRPSTTRIWRLVVVALTIVMVGPSVGCRVANNTIRDAVFVSYRDMVWARRAYNLRYGNCTRPYCEHFEAGFCSGYSDICGGGDGYVPAMPPADYRAYQYQCAEGTKCINAWFEGYPAGVAAARKEAVGEFNNVLVSRMIDSAVTQSEAAKSAGEAASTISASSSNVPPPPTAPQVSGMQMPMQMPMQVQTPMRSATMPMQMPASPMMATTYEAPPIESNNLPMSMPMMGVPSSGSQTSSYADSVPPIVTGSGVTAPQGNTPLPMAVTPASWESNRRSK